MLPIIFAPFPYLDLQRTKNRPLLVLGQSKYENSWLLIVAYITSKATKKLSDSDIFLPANNSIFKNTGLTHDSIFRLGRIGTIEISTVDKEIGFIDGEFETQIKEKLRTLFRLR
jgi:mRNA-degrading endonuclease toxin of MazEF toxin-antitoxin module